jgi:hypothetical protein
LDSNEEYLVPRDEFIALTRAASFIPYAVVKDSKWYGRGEMGWFGISHGDEDKNAWVKKVSDMLTELPDDTLFTIVDCHI